MSHSLQAIHKLDPKLNLFLHLDTLSAETMANTLSATTATSPLHGVPIALKDNLCLSGQPTTAASALLDNFHPSYTATAVERLIQAGAIPLGKTNMDEFGMGSTSETSAYLRSKNPWDITRVPGGSSGGSAAAVAAGIVPVALGTDTGGSIRQPAAYCGVTGLKPSYGRVSRHGLIAYASSLDTVGPIARSVEDVALVLQTIAGEDAMDSTSVKADVPDYVNNLPKDADLSGMTLGVVEEALGEGVHSGVSNRVREAIATLETLGAKVKCVTLPRLDCLTAAYYVLVVCESSANLARYDGVRYGMRDVDASDSSALYSRTRGKGFGHETKKRILAGTYALSAGYYDAYYVRAQRVREMVARRMRDVFEGGVDAVVMPAAPGPAGKFGELERDAVAVLKGDFMTIPASLAGLPAMSVPCGVVKEGEGEGVGMPVGMQVVGPFLGEEVVLKVGHAFQMATDFHTQMPDMNLIF